MADDDLAEMEKKIDQINRENERLRERFEYLEEKTVLVTAVERVLLEYGIPPEKVDTIIDDIRAVDGAVDRNSRGDE